MKKIILLLFMLFSITTFAQIKVVDVPKSEQIGKVGNFVATFIDMSKTANEYTIHYQDLKFRQLSEFKHFSFKDENGDFENLYKMIMSGFENMPKEDIMLDFPNDFVWLHFEKNLGVVSLRFLHAANKNPDIIGFSIYLTKRQVNKLFGKKE